MEYSVEEVQPDWDMSPALQQLFRNTDTEERCQALEAVQDKTSPTLPKSLRHVLGQSLVERPFSKDQGFDPRLGAFDGAIAASRAELRGTPPRARAGQKHFAPWQTNWALQQQLSFGKTLVHLSPIQMFEKVMFAIWESVPEDVQQLTFWLVATVQHKNLLPGYSSTAVVAGCLLFAAYALEEEVQYRKQDVERAGLRLNSHAMRTAYNALWLQRDELAAVTRKYGGSMEVLKLPMNPKGRVASWAVDLDAERRACRQEADSERERERESQVEEQDQAQHGGKRATLKKMFRLA